MAASEDYNTLVKSRRYIRAQISRIWGDVQNNVVVLPIGKIQDYKERLLSLKIEIEGINRTVQAKLPDEEDMEQVLTEDIIQGFLLAAQQDADNAGRFKDFAASMTQFMTGRKDI